MPVTPLERHALHVTSSVQHYATFAYLIIEAVTWPCIQYYLSLLSLVSTTHVKSKAMPSSDPRMILMLENTVHVNLHIQAPKIPLLIKFPKSKLQISTIFFLTLFFCVQILNPQYFNHLDNTSIQTCLSVQCNNYTRSNTTPPSS